jgi:hypothetical protein
MYRVEKIELVRVVCGACGAAIDERPGGSMSTDDVPGMLTIAVEHSRTCGPGAWGVPEAPEAPPPARKRGRPRKEAATLADAAAAVVGELTDREREAMRERFPGVAPEVEAALAPPAGWPGVGESVEVWDGYGWLAHEVVRVFEAGFTVELDAGAGEHVSWWKDEGKTWRRVGHGRGV